MTRGLRAGLLALLTHAALHGSLAFAAEQVKAKVASPVYVLKGGTANKVGTMKAGEMATVIKKHPNGKWYGVKTASGLKGWVPAARLAVVGGDAGMDSAGDLEASPPAAKSRAKKSAGPRDGDATYEDDVNARYIEVGLSQTETVGLGLDVAGYYPIKMGGGNHLDIGLAVEFYPFNVTFPLSILAPVRFWIKAGESFAVAPEVFLVESLFLKTFDNQKIPASFAYGAGVFFEIPLEKSVAVRLGTRASLKSFSGLGNFTFYGNVAF